MDLSIIITIGLITIMGINISKLKKKKIYTTFLFVSILVICARIYFSEYLEHRIGFYKINTANYLFSPFLYLVSFQFLRIIYIEYYKREPALGASKFSNYDPVEKRNINFADNIVEFIPLLIALLWQHILLKL
jgi:small neutral amino acid transporter SnatA (MarC family)